MNKWRAKKVIKYRKSPIQMKLISTFLPVLFIASSCATDVRESYTVPDLVHNMNDSTWYNRKIGTTKYLLEVKYGDPHIAIRHARQQGEDAEAFYVLAVAHTKLKDIDSAMYYVEKAVGAGLPKERFAAGPYAFFSDLFESDQYRRWFERQDIKLVHGPMVGNVFDTRAIFWSRTATEVDIEFIVSTEPKFRQPLRTAKVRTLLANGHAAQVSVEGLRPDTEYFYRAITDGEVMPKVYSFKTQPPAYQQAEFAVAFGACAAYIPWHSHMWHTIGQHDLKGLLLLGDNVYIDYPENPYIQEYCYHQRQSEREWRELVSKVPVYAVWDDHDFADNDDYGGPAIDEPSWKIPVWETFMDQWANISYGGGRDQPGIWFSFNIADVDFFMLDGRYYREGSYVNNADESLTMLGPVQKEWLKQSLLNSKATFKVIASPVPWAYEAKGTMAGRYDHWRGYKNEREELFDFLYENNIGGVVLLSGDRHRADLWTIERERGYNLYEFANARLTNTHTHNCLSAATFCYNEKNNFGKIVFNTVDAEPYLVYEIWNIDNEKVFEKKFLLNELTD
jgi:alkaline phosphatase D